MIISWLRVKPAGISCGYMPPNHPHAFQLTPLPFLPPQTVGKRQEGGAYSPQQRIRASLSPGVSPAGRVETRSCRLRSAFFSTREVSASPAGSPTALVDLHAPQAWIFMPLLPSPSGSHRNGTASRRHRGVVAQLCQSKRLHPVLLPRPLLPLPTRFISLGDWEEDGNECRRGLGSPRSEPLTFSAMLGSPAKWEPGQRFFCRLLQDMPRQLCRQ